MIDIEDWATHRRSKIYEVSMAKRILTIFSPTTPSALAITVLSAWRMLDLNYSNRMEMTIREVQELSLMADAKLNPVIRCSESQGYFPSMTGARMGLWLGRFEFDVTISNQQQRINDYSHFHVGEIRIGPFKCFDIKSWGLKSYCSDYLPAWTGRSSMWPDRDQSNRIPNLSMTWTPHLYAVSWKGVTFRRDIRS